jgi:hypothetical protein
VRRRIIAPAREASATLLAANSQSLAVARIVAVDDNGQIHFAKCHGPGVLGR